MRTWARTADNRHVPSEHVLTLTELCARWKTARKTILLRIHASELRAFRIGERTYRVTMDEVLRFERKGSEPR